MPISDEIAELYAQLLTFQASALAYVANGEDEGVRTDRASEVKGALATARGLFGTVTLLTDVPGLCAPPNVDCGGVCLPRDMCDFSPAASASQVEVKV